MSAFYFAAGYPFHCRRFIPPRAIYFASGYLFCRGRFLAAGYLFRRGRYYAGGAPGSNCTIAAICRETAMSAPLLENIRPFSTR